VSRVVVMGGWAVELEHCPLYLTSLFGQCEEYSQKIRSTPEPGMAEPVCERCGCATKNCIC